jgi:hypothetical protein
MAIETCIICGRLSDAGVLLVEATSSAVAAALVSIGVPHRDAATKARRQAGSYRAVLCHDCTDSRSDLFHSSSQFGPHGSSATW